MIILNYRGVFGKLSHLTMKKLSRRSSQGVKHCRTAAAGIIRLSEIDRNNAHGAQADFASEAVISVVAKMGSAMVDLHGMTLFVPHGSDWSEQVSLFIKDPEQFEAVHPRMIRPETTYLYFARDVFQREASQSEE